jgi:hypothetical protein
MAFYVFIYFKRAEMAEIGSRKLLVMNQDLKKHYDCKI